jgi:hypothetical protein
LHDRASASPLEIEHEFVRTGHVHKPGIAGVALWTAVEADQLRAADFDEFEMTADDRRAERLGLDTGE